MEGGLNVTISQMKSIVQSIFRCDEARKGAINLMGPPGLGKTYAIEQSAEELGAKCAVFLTATMDPTDVVGVPHPVGNVTKFLPPEDLMELTDNAEYTGPMIALFDDLPACQEQVFAALFRLFQQREVAKHKIRDNVLLCATGNRVEDRAGAQDIPTALANRFVHFQLKIDTREWRDWAIKNDIAEEIVAYVHRNGVKALHNFDPSAGFLAFPTPRSVARASSLVKAIGYDNTSDLLAAMIGCCGEGWGTEFMAFLKVRNKLIPAEKIVKDPENCKVPAEKDIDVQFATITSLVYYLKNKPVVEETVAALKYASRLPQKELSIVLSRDILISIVLDDKNAKFRAEILGSKEFQRMIPEYRKYLSI